MQTGFLIALAAAGSLFCSTRTPAAEQDVPVGQPWIFWHNGEWQTYKDGVWTPYCRAVTPDEAKNNATHSEADRAEKRPHRATGETGGTPPVGMIGEPNVAIGETTIGIGKNNLAPGQNNTALGQNNLAPGQNNTRIGPNNTVIGQTTIGIGQNNTGLGQNNMAPGRNNTGLGQNNMALGQNNTAPGQNNTALGANNTGIGPTSRGPDRQAAPVKPDREPHERKDRR